jgi:uncharacterized protein YoxC
MTDLLQWTAIIILAVMLILTNRSILSVMHVVQEVMNSLTEFCTKVASQSFAKQAQGLVDEVKRMREKR